MTKVTRSEFTGWNNHPVYYCKTYEDYTELRQWMCDNNVDCFLVSSGSGGYKFQVVTNHDWFSLR